MKPLQVSLSLALLAFCLSRTVIAQTNGSASASPRPWDLVALTNPPTWSVLERPASSDVKAITFSGLPFRGKPTRVFAWLGIPKLENGQKVPAMVLVHGGGGTAFDDWVRLWVNRGYAAIAMDTCGQVPVGTYGKWFRDEQGGPPGWGGLDQINPRVKTNGPTMLSPTRSWPTRSSARCPRWTPTASASRASPGAATSPASSPAWIPVPTRRARLWLRLLS